MTSYRPQILIQNPFYNENGDVCKKLELSILKIDQEIAILSSKKVFQKISNFLKDFVSLGKIAITWPILKIILNFFSG